MFFSVIQCPGSCCQCRYRSIMHGNCYFPSVRAERIQFCYGLFFYFIFIASSKDTTEMLAAAYCTAYFYNSRPPRPRPCRRPSACHLRGFPLVPQKFSDPDLNQTASTRATGAAGMLLIFTFIYCLGYPILKACRRAAGEDGAPTGTGRSTVRERERNSRDSDGDDDASMRRRVADQCLT